MELASLMIKFRNIDTPLSYQVVVRHHDATNGRKKGTIRKQEGEEIIQNLPGHKECAYKGSYCHCDRVGNPWGSGIDEGKGCWNQVGGIVGRPLRQNHENKKNDQAQSLALSLNDRDRVPVACGNKGDGTDQGYPGLSSRQGKQLGQQHILVPVEEPTFA